MLPSSRDYCLRGESRRGECKLQVQQVEGGRSHGAGLVRRQLQDSFGRCVCVTPTWSCWRSKQSVVEGAWDLESDQESPFLAPCDLDTLPPLSEPSILHLEQYPLHWVVVKGGGKKNIESPEEICTA